MAPPDPLASTANLPASTFQLADKILAFQCRPKGHSEAAGLEAAVALDYAEVRLSYTVHAN